MVINKLLWDSYTKAEAYLRDIGFLAGKSGRHMRYPYTVSAKIAQFPYAFYLKNNCVVMYGPVAIAIAFYFITKIHALANSEANQRNWAEIKLKEMKEHH